LVPGIVSIATSDGEAKADRMYLWGRNWTRAELEARVGSLSQIGGVTRFEYCDGKARGLTALRVRTACGLEFSVLPDRGLDIFEASYQGRSLCWHSPAGLSHPAYYDSRGANWMKTFPGGLLTTCGLSTAGSPSLDQGEELGLHGSISNTPAESVTWSEEWIKDELMFSIHGQIKEGSVFGPNLVNYRQISSSLSARSIHLVDRIVNEGDCARPLMVVYHCNFGFPLLSDRSRIYCKSKHVEARTQFAHSHLASWTTFEGPIPAVDERCYYHDIETDEDGYSRVLLVDDDAAHSLAIELAYNSVSLPRLVEWKSVRPKHYVLGLEPSNCKVDGRRRERADGTLKFLGPGESAEMKLRIRVLVGEQEIASAIKTCSEVDQAIGI
jgi:hypothetical protein